jgi:hypothetical protein
MTEIRTVTTLQYKRYEIRASIRMYEKKIAQARADLSHITAVLQLFEVSGEGAGPSQVRGQLPAIQPG